MKQKRIILFNASALKYTDCDRKIYWNMFHGYTYALSNNDTHYGTCYHEYQKELALSGGNFMVAMKAAEKLFRETPVNMKSKKEYLDIQHLRRTCLDHFENHYQMDEFQIHKQDIQCPVCKGSGVITEGDRTGICINCNNFGKVSQPLVELKLHIPYYSDDEVEVVLVCTIDKLGKFRGGCHAIGDYKSSASFDQKTFLENYQMDSQMMFYVNMIYLMAAQYPDSIYAEMCAGNNLRVFIDGVFLSSTKPSVFRRSEVFHFNNERLQEFRVMLDSAIQKVVRIYKDYIKLEQLKSEGFVFEQEPLPKREGIMTKACTANFGNRCPFFNACAAPDNIIVNHILKNNFVQKEYGMSTYGGGE